MTEGFCIGACCAFGAERWPGLSFVEHADAGGQPAPGAVLAADAIVRPLYFEPPITFALAAHEGAHAVIGTLGGLHVASVQVGAISQCSIDWAQTGPVSTGAVLRMILSGKHAENRARRHEYRMHDWEIVEFLTAVGEGRGGGCDECRIARVAIGAGSNGSAVALWREAEGQTLGLITRPDVWRAIRAIANRLMTGGWMSGGEVELVVRTMVDGYGAPTEGKEIENV